MVCKYINNKLLVNRNSWFNATLCFREVVVLL